MPLDRPFTLKGFQRVKVFKGVVGSVWECPLTRGRSPYARSVSVSVSVSLRKPLNSSTPHVAIKAASAQPS